MRHVDHENGADRVRDLAEALEVDDARISRTAGDDELRLVFFGERRDFVHVDALVLAAHAVGHRLEPLAGLVDRRAVGEMPTRREVEAHENVAGLEQREEHRLVRLRAGMRLHIGEGTVEQTAGAVDRELLGDIDEFAAAIVAAAGITFRVFVGEDRALRLEHGAADDVLRRDQFDLVLLTGQFLSDSRGNLRIGGRQILVEKGGILRRTRRPATPRQEPRPIAGRASHLSGTYPYAFTRCSARQTAKTCPAALSRIGLASVSKYRRRQRKERKNTESQPMIEKTKKI